MNDELSGFEFKGEGWYQTDTDVILVIKRPDELLEAWCWSGRDSKDEVLKTFFRVASLPDH